MEQITAYEALMRLNGDGRHNGLYVQFMYKKYNRQKLIKIIEKMTEIVCADEKVLSSVKERARMNLEKYRGMLKT